MSRVFDKRGGSKRTPVKFKDGQPVFANREGGKKQSRSGASKGRTSGRAGYGAEGYRSNAERKPYRKDDHRGEERRPYSKEHDRGEARKPYRAKGAPDMQNISEDSYDNAPGALTADELPYIIMGRNAVREAVKSGRSIDRILTVPEPDGSLREVINLARDRKIQIREVDRKKLDELCMPFGHGGRPGNHQGIVAQVPGVEYCELSDIIELAEQRGEPLFIILLDGIEDPHNLGSIIRSAECAGAHGVVIPKRRSATVTAAVAKASAGAVEHIKVARVANISSAIETLKQHGVWIAGADMSGSEMTGVDLTGALALVIGGEGSGLSQLVRSKCDFLAAIPVFGQISSLNAAVAAAVLMYEKRRQDAAKNK